jgi:Phosphate-induced protein 1 conserved region
MKTTLGHGFLALTLGLFAVASVQAQGQSDKETNPNKIPHRINPGHPTSDAPTAGSTGTITPVIQWNGGPVMTGSPNVHLIWYGNWAQANGSDDAGGQQIVRDYMYGVGGSPYLQINAAYTGSNGQVSGLIGSTFEANVGYTNGKRLRDADISKIVSNYIASSGRSDSNAVYFVLTSSDVAETSGFCSKYCGWHTSGTISGANIKYSFVGNANRCLSGCAAQSISPNNNAGVDGMVSVIAHELEEALTDPNPRSGWTDSSGSENADKCAWTFGANLPTATNGASYNITLNASLGGTRNFLVQRNLDVFSKCYYNYQTKAQ